MDIYNQNIRMKKTIRLTEKEITSIVKKVISEQTHEREKYLTSLIYKVKEAIGEDMEMTGEDEIDGKRLLKSLSTKIFELKKLEVELKSSLLGYSLTTKERYKKSVE
jgi:hypothetical protein